MGSESLEADAVVIGGGPCGLSASLTISFGGASVILFEKRSKFCELANNVEGMFAVRSDLQIKDKIFYDVEDRFKAHMASAGWMPDARLVRVWMEKTAETIEWLKSLGVQFSRVSVHTPGYPFVWHMFKEASSAPFRPLAERVLADKNITTFFETPVKKILKENNKIVGVVAEDKEGNVIRVKCKAVVIATGGYGDNREWVEKYCRGGKYIESLIKAGQTGDGIKAAWEVGAASAGLGVIQAYPFPPGENGATLLTMMALQPNLWVNLRGERFCDESIVWTFPEVINALVRQPQVTAYNLFDQDMVEDLKKHGLQFWIGELVDPYNIRTEIDAELKRGIKESKVYEAESIEELAIKVGINPEKLKITVEEYNDCCNKNYDFLFFKDRRYLHPINKPKFYACKLVIRILITEGGIRVNHKMEVLDEQLNPIPGLYAGGCCTEGPVGASYPLVSTGGSSSFAVTSGRIAGENVLKYLGK
jgi:fumarate reductase flavoprotein subunit